MGVGGGAASTYCCCFLSSDRENAKLCSVHSANFRAAESSVGHWPKAVDNYPRVSSWFFFMSHPSDILPTRVPLNRISSNSPS